LKKLAATSKAALPQAWEIPQTTAQGD
jgi:hypothetical protein